MKRIIYTCDRCRQEIEGNPVRIFTEAVDRETDDFLYEETNPELKALDFCRDCSEFMVGLIKIHCRTGVPATVNRDFEKAVQEMTETAEEAGPPPMEEKIRRKLDTGKIQALRNAKWPVKKIAEEMNCSEQAVYNVLKKLEMPVDNKKAPEPESTEQSKTN